MDMPAGGRRQPRRQLNPSSTTPYSSAEFQGPTSTSGHDTFYGGGGGGFYDPSFGHGVPMFEESHPSSTSSSFIPQHSTSGPYFTGGMAGPSAQPPPSSTPFNIFTPNTAQGGIGGPSLFDPNLIAGVGSQMFASQAGNVLNQFTQDIQVKGKGWVEPLKYYFAVDTTYVIKKILLLFFPFAHKDWAARFNPDKPIAPRDDINVPDLYIPSMAFVTYVLVAGFILGQSGGFSPEKLGLMASSLLAWLMFEVVIYLGALWVMAISSSLGFWHLMAFASYKFVPMIGALCVGFILNRTAYYVFLIYSCASLGFFLIRSLHVTIQTTSQSPGGHGGQVRSSLYLVVIVCILQMVMIYWQTRSLVI